MFAGERPQRARAPTIASEDAFGGVLLEIQLANLSLSGGAALEEAGMTQQPHVYQEALQELRLTARHLEDAVAVRGGGLPGDGQLGFRFRPPDDANQIGSVSLAEARNTLSASIDRTFDVIVDESRSVATAVWQEASALPGAKVFNDVVGLAGDLRSPAEKIGTLIGAIPRCCGRR